MLISIVCTSLLLVTFPSVSAYSYQIPINRPAEAEISIPTIVTAEWQWVDINPSRDLEWHDCYAEFQCARLDVPLDWLEPSDNERVVLAIVKLPARHLENYMGPLFTNPGGPGGSGVSHVLRSAKAIQKIVGENHDIISFDPRGIGASAPALYCWPSRQSEKLWALQDVGVIDAHDGMVYDAYARASASSNLCTSVVGGNETSGIYGAFSYVGTTSVARDMLEILNKTGHEKLRYWGFSYGTMLGGMFAAMYPEKIERMVNDGNVDYKEWTTCAHKNALHDTDIVMEAFYTFCHSAGPSNCALWSPTPDLIKARLDTIIDSLKTDPIIVPASLSLLDTSELPELITYSSLKRLISTSLYQPVRFFPSFARVCSALENRDGAPFLDAATAWGYKKKQFSCDIPNIPPGPNDVESNDDAFRAIMCSDGGEMTDSVEEFTEYAEGLMEMSKAAGAVNILFRIACVGWKAKAKWRFTGPFEGNTSHPILFLANQADNITPLRSARANAKGFNNSVVLIQNSYGHTSIAAASSCTAEYLRQYFQNGTLPDPDTKCEADIVPFGRIDEVGGLSLKEAELRDEMWELGETMTWVPFPGGRF
ncbi:hydrolase [Hyphodiscus hymeniophilus]|uniref:Hydrolase n=1 Tax=Hyphodiscus hymeniophilus TaxID=353542 RepID=A0A9P6SLH5_9HELO|nr:hydrolase [Hyphodiscus hymeniophilus]